MKAILAAALVGAVPALAATLPSAYQTAAVPPAYETTTASVPSPYQHSTESVPSPYQHSTESSATSTSPSSSSSKTTSTTAVASPTTTGSTGGSWPACWSSCFQQYGVSSESGLCAAPLSTEVSSCITTSCQSAGDANAAQQYEAWVDSYCSAKTVTDVTTQYTTICPVTETHTTGASTSTTVYQTTSTVTASITTPAWPTWTSTVTASTVESVYTTVTVTWGGVWTSTQTWVPSTAHTGAWTTVYETKSIYTTICPVTETWVSSGTTSILSYITTATGPASYPTGTDNGNGSGKSTASGKPTASNGNGNGKPTTATGKSTSSANGKPTGLSSTSSAASKCTKAAAKPTEKCVPCQGQPGSNPETFCGLDINTNYWNEAPITCRTVTYDFTITEGTISPDGVPKAALLVNGQMPGPVISANWGDTVVINVHNQLALDSTNGTTLHWHGIRQNNTNSQDGVPSITQCPIVPGQSQTYTWVASSYGTSWWHSHFSLQTWEGLFGPIIINGPASAEFDESEVVMLQDWAHGSVEDLYDESQQVAVNTNRSSPLMDDGLINGMGVWAPPGDPVPSGKRWQLDVTAGKRYRLQIVNAAIAATFVFYVDQHELTVIAADFVPVVPFTVTTLPINIGQRYDVILTADQPVANYWMRADNQQPCAPMVTFNNTMAIVSYAGAPAGSPTSQAYGYQPTCGDIPSSSLVPVLPITAGTAQQTVEETVVIGVDPANTNLYKWTLSGTTFQSQWGEPTLLSILETGTIPSFSGNLAISAPNLGEWVYVIIESPIPVAHPIHLHGHEFLILAQGAGQYTSSVPLNLVNPTRRDVAQMPADPLQGEGSYLVIAFWTDNPGVWLMHCHIGWHQSMGFALQIIEGQSRINNTVADECAIQEQCAAWNAYSAKYNVIQGDDGI